MRREGLVEVAVVNKNVKYNTEKNKITLGMASVFSRFAALRESME